MGFAVFEDAPGLGWTLALAGLIVLGGVLWIEPLAPGVTPLWGLPPFFGGVLLWVLSTWSRGVGLYGRVTGGVPWIHRLAQLLGAGITAAAVVFFLKQPPAGSSLLYRQTYALRGFCLGSAGERAEPALLPMLRSMSDALPNQTPALRDAAIEELRRTAARCEPLITERFSDPRGAHRSWRLLRDVLAAHPEWIASGPVWTMEWRPLTEPWAQRESVEVLLEP